MDKQVVTQSAANLAKAIDAVVGEFEHYWRTMGRDGIKQLTVWVAESLEQSFGLPHEMALTLAKVGTFGAISNRLGTQEAFKQWAISQGITQEGAA